MKYAYMMKMVLPLLLLTSCTTNSSIDSTPMVEPSVSADTYYSYKDTVGLDHLSKPEPVDSLVEPSYEDLEKYITSTDYYASLDAMHPSVDVMTMDDNTIGIHFNSNNDQWFMISASEYGYIIQRSYLITQRFTYTKSGQIREAEMNVTNRLNYFDDAPLPNEYFVSLVVPDSDDEINYQIYYDQTRQSFYTTDANAIYEDTITFAKDLQDKMVNTMGYVSSSFLTLDHQGMQFIVELLFDYYQLPYVILASPVQGISDPNYHQVIFMHKAEYDPYEATFLPFYHCNPSNPYNENVMIHNIYLDILDLDTDQKLYTIVDVGIFNRNPSIHRNISIESYINNQQIDASELISKYALIDVNMINEVKAWFDQCIDYIGFNENILENAPLTFDDYQEAELIETYGLFNDRLIFSIPNVEGVRDILVRLPNK